MTTKKHPTILFTLLFLLTILIISGCKNNTNTSTQNNNISESDRITKELQDKNNAVKISDLPAFTIDIKELLKGHDDKLVFDASLNDIYEKEGVVYAQFNSGIFPEYFITLKCNREKLPSNTKDINPIISAYESNYVVVAKINDVQKPITEIQGSIDDKEAGTVSFQYGLPNAVLLNGECIEIQRINK